MARITISTTGLATVSIDGHRVVLDRATLEALRGGLTALEETGQAQVIEAGRLLYIPGLDRAPPEGDDRRRRWGRRGGSRD